MAVSASVKPRPDGRKTVVNALTDPFLIERGVRIIDGKRVVLRFPEEFSEL